VVSSQSPRAAAVVFVKAFNQAMADPDNGVKPVSVAYFDGIKLVRKLTDGTSKDRREFRSEAFRIRRVFDEFWFVLHVTVGRERFSYDLDVFDRNKNLVWALLLGAMVLSLLSLAAGIPFGGPLFAIVAGYCLFDQGLTGGAITSYVLDFSRGAQRRSDRMASFRPAVMYALQSALESSERGYVNEAPSAQVPHRAALARVKSFAGWICCGLVLLGVFFYERDKPAVAPAEKGQGRKEDGGGRVDGAGDGNKDPGRSKSPSAATFDKGPVTAPASGLLVQDQDFSMQIPKGCVVERSKSEDANGVHVLTYSVSPSGDQSPVITTVIRWPLKETAFQLREQDESDSSIAKDTIYDFPFYSPDDTAISGGWSYELSGGKKTSKLVNGGRLYQVNNLQGRDDKFFELANQVIANIKFNQ